MEYSWKAVPGHIDTYTRPLGARETCLACNALHKGTDIFAQVTIASKSATLFSKANVHRSWLRLKKKYPLIGAKIVERQHLSGFDFVVSEEKTNSIGPQEIVFMSANSDEEALEIVQKSLGSERVLSSDLLGVLWLISVVPSSENTERLNPFRAWHLIFNISHCISDTMATCMKITSFLDTLTSDTPSEHVREDTFKEYLSLFPCVEDLNPSRRNLAKLRWRRATATIIENQQNRNLIGERTMPRKKITYTPESPVVSGMFKSYFTKEATKNILATCREAGVTLGNAMPVLFQIAHARLFHRLHAQGLISQTEWDKVAWQLWGPVNLRPFLDSMRSPYGCCALSVYNVSLPRIPMPAMDNPAYDDLLTKERFLYRCKLSQKQSKKFLKHPLLVEIAEAREKKSASTSKDIVMWWRAVSENKASAEKSENYTLGVPCEFSCSGDLTSLLPSTYPLTHSIPSLWVKDFSLLTRCLPRDFYLTSLTYNGTMKFLLFADITSYDQAMVQEWLNYVCEAAQWYLGSRIKAGSQTNTCSSKL